MGGPRPPGEDALRPLSLTIPRVVVLKSKRTLYLLDNHDLVRTYPVVLGPCPTGDKVRAGDGRTPLGTFRICTKNAGSRNHRFLGIDYPNADVARRGFELGLITPGEAGAIFDAAAGDRCPPWTTPLGGGIGLHGGGTAPADWTAGCIALSDVHIEELFQVLRIGDAVEILP